MVNPLDTLEKNSQAKLIALLASVICYIFIIPLFSGPLALISSSVLVILIIATAAIVLQERRNLFLIVMGITICIELVTSFTDYYLLNIISRLATLLLFFFIVSRLVLEILKQKDVSLRTILEAINGYLLLGLAFSGIVRTLIVIDEKAYNTTLTEIDALYHTFVTMTTLGFGDIVPVEPIAKSLTLIIAISGQFYVGVIVAILVGKYASK